MIKTFPAALVAVAAAVFAFNPSNVDSAPLSPLTLKAPMGRVSLIAAGASPTDSAVTPVSCMDRTGVEISFVAREHDYFVENKIAFYEIVADDGEDAAFIFYDPQDFQKYSLPFRTFTMLTACIEANKNGSDLIIGNDPSTIREKQRDYECEAAEDLRNVYHYTQKDIDLIQEEILQSTPSTAVSTVPRARAAMVRMCYKTSQ